jgi:phosphoheptose isomerase
MTQDTVRGPQPDAHTDLLLRRPAQGGQSGAQPGRPEDSQPGRQHIGALVGALSVLDTRLLDDWGQRLAALMSRGGRLLTAGTGGSAAQAQHFAAQFTGSAAYRRARPAIALLAAVPAVSAVAGGSPMSASTGSAGTMSASTGSAGTMSAGTMSAGTGSAGTGPEEAFAHQVRSHGRPGDVLLAMSTSGRNHGLLRAVAAAQAGGIAAWCLTGPAPNPLADACDEAVCVYPAGARALSLTATVQEAHQVALHLICLSFDATAAGPGA